MKFTSSNSHNVWHQIYIFYCDGTAGSIVHAFLSWETKKVEEGVEGTANVYWELKLDTLKHYNFYGEYFQGAEYMVPFSSCSHPLTLKLSTFLSENIIIWVRILPYITEMMIFFTPYLFLIEEKVSFDGFLLTTWEQRKRDREEKGTTNSVSKCNKKPQTYITGKKEIPLSELDAIYRMPSYSQGISVIFVGKTFAV